MLNPQSAANSRTISVCPPSAAATLNTAQQTGHQVATCNRQSSRFASLLKHTCPALFNTQPQKDKRHTLRQTTCLGTGLAPTAMPVWHPSLVQALDLRKPTALPVATASYDDEVTCPATLVAQGLSSAMAHTHGSHMQIAGLRVQHSACQHSGFARGEELLLKWHSGTTVHCRLGRGTRTAQTTTRVLHSNHDHDHAHDRADIVQANASTGTYTATADIPIPLTAQDRPSLLRTPSAAQPTSQVLQGANEGRPNQRVPIVQHTGTITSLGKPAAAHLRWEAGGLE